MPVIIKIGPLEIDRDQYVVYVDGAEEVFSREKNLNSLYFLANNPGKVFGRDALVKELFGVLMFMW